MRKLLIIVCFLLIPTNLFAKTIRYYEKPIVNNNNIPCFELSKVHFVDCLNSCISFQSPSYIVDFCLDKCNLKVGNAFYRCLIKNKYVVENIDLYKQYNIQMY